MTDRTDHPDSPLPIPRTVEAALAATVAAVVVALIAWRLGADIILAAAMGFLIVFLVTLWRNRTSTIHHRSSSGGRRATRRR